MNTLEDSVGPVSMEILESKTLNLLSHVDIGDKTYVVAEEGVSFIIR